jgi:hypothetical protein
MILSETGRNTQETAVIAPNFPSTFANIATVTLDDQVDGPATHLFKSKVIVNGISSYASGEPPCLTGLAMHVTLILGSLAYAG